MGYNFDIKDINMIYRRKYGKNFYPLSVKQIKIIKNPLRVMMIYIKKQMKCSLSSDYIGLLNGMGMYPHVNLRD